MKKISIFTLVVVLLTACQKDNQDMTSEMASTANAVSEKASSRPINLTLTSTANPASPALVCSMPGVPFGIANSGYFLHGNASHLGLINTATSMGQDGSCNLNGATLILSTTTTGQIVAANGDKITYTGADEIQLLDIVLNNATTGPINGVWTITGGTGRFTGATGSFTITGTVDLTTPGGPSFSVTGQGTITY